MSYEGDKLVDMIDNLDRVTKRTGHRLAEKFQDRGKANIALNTPVATLHLRDSYKKTPIRYQQMTGSIRWSAFAWEGTVYTEVEYAPFVEMGTGLWGPKRKKYKIAPKKPGGVLAFTPYERAGNGAVILDVSGNVQKAGLITVRFVMHPGSPGQHMFRIGATLTEHEIVEWSREPMRMWQTEVESRFARFW